MDLKILAMIGLVALIDVCAMLASMDRKTGRSLDTQH